MATTEPLTAVYTPTGNYAATTPGSLSLPVNPPPANPTTASGSIPLAVTVPLSGTFTLTVNTTTWVVLGVNSAGTTATGTTTPVVLTDTYNSYPGWSVTGEATQWTGVTNPSAETKLPREIQDLIDQSAAAPPELAADILLRLVEAGKIPDKKIKTDLLEQAFVLAGSARFPIRMIGATVEGGNMDSDVGVRWRALENGLDTLSLRCRVIRIMLNVDRKRALELFRSMPPVMIPARSCSDAMVERVDLFYETLALLVNQAFSETGAGPA